MHQINLERMSPVVHAQDGVAFPDTLVGTDSHTPHVDALGVIAIGVGGLEAESVMLGRASYMRLPDIVGVELIGERQPGITATDIVLAITEFLREQRVVSTYLEFFGPGATCPNPWGSRNHFQYDSRIWRHRSHVLHRPAYFGLLTPDRARGAASSVGRTLRQDHWPVGRCHGRCGLRTRIAVRSFNRVPQHRWSLKPAPSSRNQRSISSGASVAL